ncbi:hypothetical protein O7626_00760 [Micromonospora sp. WMMD1102]|uniref:hypothetical protein n=1 Tax=Micromonospora sp. WMMD1102 TaxID=3016105 RepID=UPI0024158414|nr:hypothetical protein [Micromonospora sp. WMMD1102]MDG4784478.1 hypothetical protein [Micromonospora sp. WMMD1102]
MDCWVGLAVALARAQGGTTGASKALTEHPELVSGLFLTSTGEVDPVHVAGWLAMALPLSP